MKSDYLLIFHSLLQLGALGTFMYAKCDFDKGIKCNIIENMPTTTTTRSTTTTVGLTTTGSTNETSAFPMTSMSTKRPDVVRVAK